MKNVLGFVSALLVLSSAPVVVLADNGTWQEDVLPGARADGSLNIILINGMLSWPDTWENFVNNTLKVDPLLVGKCRVYRFGYNPADSVHQSYRSIAANLGNKINSNILANNPDAKLILIGHSKGGLVARSFIEEFGGNNNLIQLITVGTPHHGSPVADSTWLATHFCVLGNIAADIQTFTNTADLGWDQYFLLPDDNNRNVEISLMNSVLNHQSDLLSQYALITGQITASDDRSPKSALKPWLSNLSLILASDNLGPNDGLVPSTSALLTGTDPSQFNGPAREIVAGYNHVSILQVKAGTDVVEKYVDKAVNRFYGPQAADKASFVSDVTIPDGTSITATKPFNKIWKIKNTGQSHWGNAYKWVYDGGDKMSGPDYINVPITAPGSTWDASINMTTPAQPGTYQGYYRMQDQHGNKFGDRVWVKITVPAALTDGLAYVSDVTIPDGTSINVSQGYTKTWRVKNTGTSTWGSGYKWTFDGGDQMGGPNSIDVSSTGPGSTLDLSVNLTAPSTPGNYQGFWKMQAPNGQKFGDRVWVKVTVVANSTKTFISETADVATGAGAVGFWKYGTAAYWHDVNGIGDGGHMYWTYNNDAAHGVDNMADWRPNLPDTRNYEVFVWIPRNYATTRDAHYQVYAADGRHDVVINQLSYSDAWVSLGTYAFNSGSSGYLRIIDQTGESYASTMIGVDAAKWVAK